MKLFVEEATPSGLAQIASWRYEPPYDFYDGDQEVVVHPERYYMAYDAAGALVGFYYYESKGNVLEFGLGLHPDLTGHGHGLEFFRVGLEFGRDRFRPHRIVLAVAAFNERARIVYERAGFEVTGRHVRALQRSGEVEFIDMEER